MRKMRVFDVFDKKYDRFPDGKQPYPALSAPDFNDFNAACFLLVYDFHTTGFVIRADYRLKTLATFFESAGRFEFFYIVSSERQTVENEFSAVVCNAACDFVAAFVHEYKFCAGQSDVIHIGSSAL